MPKDKIFSTPLTTVEPFAFDAQVVRVFDDMLDRSVPLYRQSLLRQAQLARHFYQADTVIYDLGCSNGNLGLSLVQAMQGRPFRMVAADTSAEMLESYRQRLRSLSEQGSGIDLVQEDIRSICLEPASVIVVNLTLQFIPVEDRDALLRKIYQALVPGGVLLLTEKVRHRDDVMDRLQQDFYYRFKLDNGYSELEVSQKRQALDDVLIPETVEQHEHRLHAAGFVHTDLWMKWFNFASLLAVKGR